MTSIKNKLNSLDFSSQISEVKKIIESARVDTTFWGSRVIKVAGFEGSVSVEALASKIVKNENKLSTTAKFDPINYKTRGAVRKIVQNFYKETDVKIQNSNFFTRFLNWIREFHVNPYTPRFFIDEQY